MIYKNITKAIFLKRPNRIIAEVEIDGHKEIEVDYLDRNFKPQHGKYTGFTAQIIQHEIDHFDGILI